MNCVKFFRAAGMEMSACISLLSISRYVFLETERKRENTRPENIIGVKRVFRSERCLSKRFPFFPSRRALGEERKKKKND